MCITNSANEKSSQGDKFDLLMNKFTQLEEAFKEERRIRVTQETELKNLKKITIPNLEKQLEDKENLLKSTFIEKIKIEKMMNNNLKSELNKDVPFSFLNKSDDILKLSKLEYYQNAYKELRKKYNDLLEEKTKSEQEFMSKLEMEKEKIRILIKDSEILENKSIRKSNDMKSLSESNKNLLIELRSINSILDEVNRHKEAILMELSFYKSEYEITKNYLKDAQSKLHKLENEFKATSKLLLETQNKLSSVNVSNYIFNVVRVGRLYESNTDLVFTKDEKGHMVLIIKYVTTSIKYQILEIKDVRIKEGDENMICIEYVPEKNLRTEYFRTNEGLNIIKIFHEFQKKSIEQSDSKKVAAEQNKKIENIGANLNDILSFP